MVEFPVPTFTESDAKALGALMDLPRPDLAELVTPLGFLSGEDGTFLSPIVLRQCYDQGVLYVGDLVAFSLQRRGKIDQQFIAEYFGFNRPEQTVLKSLLALPYLCTQSGENFANNWPSKSSAFASRAGLGLLRASQQVGRMGEIPDPIPDENGLKGLFKDTGAASATPPNLQFTSADEVALGEWFRLGKVARVRLLATPIGFVLRDVLPRKDLMILHGNRIEFLGDLFGSDCVVDEKNKNSRRYRRYEAALRSIGFTGLTKGLPGWPSRNQNSLARYALLKLAIQISGLGSTQPFDAAAPTRAVLGKSTKQVGPKAVGSPRPFTLSGFTKAF